MKHGDGSVMAWAYVAVNGTGSKVLINDVMADRSSRMNSEVDKALLSAQTQLNPAKVTCWCHNL